MLWPRGFPRLHHLWTGSPKAEPPGVLSTAVPENLSTTILQPCLCCEPWKTSSYTAGFCASINKRLEKDNFYCHQGWLQNRNFAVLILLVSQGNCPLMHTASSSASKFSQLHADVGCILWESENNKAWCKETICFPWGKFPTNKCGKRYQALACERNEFLRHPPHCGIGYHRRNIFHPNSYP